VEAVGDVVMLAVVGTAVVVDVELSADSVVLSSAAVVDSAAAIVASDVVVESAYLRDAIVVEVGVARLKTSKRKTRSRTNQGSCNPLLSKQLDTHYWKGVSFRRSAKRRRQR
jgi:hypothetical protein